MLQQFCQQQEDYKELFDRKSTGKKIAHRQKRIDFDSKQSEYYVAMATVVRRERFQMAFEMLGAINVSVCRCSAPLIISTRTCTVHAVRAMDNDYYDK